MVYISVTAAIIVGALACWGCYHWGKATARRELVAEGKALP